MFGVDHAFAWHDPAQSRDNLGAAGKNRLVGRRHRDH
jgi:hypothetical protein